MTYRTMRNVFGWSLPPGVTQRMIDDAIGGGDDTECEFCGQTFTGCVCPECPVCGGVGDPICYEPVDVRDLNDHGHIIGPPYHGGHGLCASLGQVVMKADTEARWKAEAEAEAAEEAAYEARHGRACIVCGGDDDRPCICTDDPYKDFDDTVPF